MDPSVAPTGILSSQAKNQPLSLLGERRPATGARTAGIESPLQGHQPSVPVEHGPGSHDYQAVRDFLDTSGSGGQESAVEIADPGPGVLALQNPYLVAENHDLEFGCDGPICAADDHRDQDSTEQISQ